MQLNMLDDLAEAMKALDGKKLLMKSMGSATMRTCTQLQMRK